MKPTAFYDPSLRWQKTSLCLMNELFCVVETQEHAEVSFVNPYTYHGPDNVLCASNCTFPLHNGLSLYGEVEFLKTITPTAEHTFGLIHALHRSIYKQIDSVQTQWNRRTITPPAKPLSEMSILIVGYGRIGKMVGKICVYT
jgi:hypothetical protein